MKQMRSIEDQSTDDASLHADVRSALHHVLCQTQGVSTSERWSHLRQRIAEHQHFRLLRASTTVHGAEWHHATLLLRPWSSLSVPIM